MNKKPVSFVINDKDWKRLKDISEKEFTSVSAIIRQAIHEKIERETKKPE